MTGGDSTPAPVLVRDPPLDALGGGGTGVSRSSPAPVLPQLLRSRLTCEGGGATTAGEGRVILGADETSRGGAETGGATTSTACVNWTRELAISRGVSRGAGAMTVGASESAARILSRETLGAGGTTADVSAGALRGLVRPTSGAGGTMLAVKLPAVRLAAAFNSGEGGTALIAGSSGAVREERNPSAGGGPGLVLNASRFATAESECGRLILGASTTFSLGLSPRATRMVCVRWCACWPPARPVLPDCAPPRSCVCGSSSAE
jgi:hypothetical protein